MLYSNTLEDPGVIANSAIGMAQIDFLRAALERVKREKFSGALLFAHHHPPYALGGQHGSSVQMRRQMDAAVRGRWECGRTRCSPAMRTTTSAIRGIAQAGSDIPYVICGNGGHNVQKLQPPNGIPLRTPQVFQAKTATDDAVTFENYDDTDYGYLRVLVSSAQLRIEYHPASDGVGSKTPDDSVTIDLAKRRQVPYQTKDLGMPAQARGDPGDAVVVAQ